MKASDRDLLLIKMESRLTGIETRLSGVENELSNHISHLWKLFIALVGVIGAFTANLLLKLL